MKKLLSILLIVLISISTLFAANDRPKLALVLSGGAAKGFTHVPIIEELERRGIYPDLVVGTSMGALIGGLYSAGYTPEDIRGIANNNDLMEIIFHLQYNNNQKEKRAFSLFKDTTFSIGFNTEGEIGSASGVLDDQYLNFFINKTVSKVIDVRDFDDLSIPYRSVGTNYATGEKIVFSEGSFFDALRSSMSIPVMFPTHIIEDGRYLADGGLVDNLPVDVALDWGADIVIAVDVNEDARRAADQEGYLDSFSGSFSQLMVIITQTNAAVQQKKATYLLVPETAGSNMLAFNDANTFFEIGEKCVQDNIEVFDEIEEIYKNYIPMEEPLRYEDRTPITVTDIKGDEKIVANLKSFIGVPLTTEKITELEGRLDLIRKMNNFESVLYRIIDNEMIIETKDFDNMSSLMTLGLNGGLYLNYNKSKLNFYFAPEVLVETNINIGKHDLNIGLMLGRRNELYTSYLIPFNARTNIYVGLDAGFGSYSSISYEGMPENTPTNDLLVRGTSGLTTNFSDHSRLDVEFLFEYHRMGRKEVNDQPIDVWPNNNVFYTGTGLYYTFNSHATKAELTKGIRLDLNANVGFGSAFYYSFKGKAEYVLPINDTMQRINFKAYTGFFRMPYELLSSWDYTYFGSPTRDSLYGEIEWQLNATSMTNGFYVAASLFAGAYSSELIDPLLDPLTTYIPYSTINDWYLGASCAIGYATNNGNIELRAKTSFTGQFCISLALV